MIETERLRLGVSLSPEQRLGPRRARLLDRVAELGLDHVAVGDHVSFHGGSGSDGLISAAALLATRSDVDVLLGVYLLALRHPLLAARQLVDLEVLAPGHLVLGVGVGGEDRSEVSNSGVDPGTRGRRLDESLTIVRALLRGETVTHDGEFFTLRDARVLPAPGREIPVVIGGRGPAAVRRAATLGDGWLGIFCSARRFARTRLEVLEAASDRPRSRPPWFGLTVWCGLDDDERMARELLAERLTTTYRIPFSAFEHLAPAGRPDQVAEWLLPYVEAGAVSLTLLPVGRDPEAVLGHAATIRSLLTAQPGGDD